jgi:hypothetical protein
MRTMMVFLLAAAVVGCGSSGGPVTVHPVSGQVLYANRPAAGVQVFFYPTSAPTVPRIPSNPFGVTGPDGRFTLTTYQEGDGAAEGAYQVILLWPLPRKSDQEEADTDRLLGWYDAAHTRLRVRVKAGENSLPPFKIAPVSGPPPVSEGIPGRN